MYAKVKIFGSILLLLAMLVTAALPVSAQSVPDDAPNKLFLPAMSTSQGVDMRANAAAGGAYTETTIEKVPLNQLVNIPCANEQVLLEGNLLMVSHVTYSGNNPPNFVLRWVHNPQGVKGYGTVSGDKYQGTGVTMGTFTSNVLDYPLVYTEISNFRIIGQGTGNNFLVHYLYHVTFDNNAVLRSDILIDRIECR